MISLVIYNLKMWIFITDFFFPFWLIVCKLHLVRLGTFFLSTICLSSGGRNFDSRSFNGDFDEFLVKFYFWVFTLNVKSFDTKERKFKSFALYQSLVSILQKLFLHWFLELFVKFRHGCLWEEVRSKFSHCKRWIIKFECKLHVVKKWWFCSSFDIDKGSCSIILSFQWINKPSLQDSFIRKLLFLHIEFNIISLYFLNCELNFHVYLFSKSGCKSFCKFIKVFSFHL